MRDTGAKRRIDTARDILVGKRKFFTGHYARNGWPKPMAPSLGGREMLGLYGEGIANYLDKLRVGADVIPLRGTTRKGGKTTAPRTPYVLQHISCICRGKLLCAAWASSRATRQ